MKVLLPGSYDPITLGHLDIIRRAAREHEVYVVIFVNPEKTYTFSVEERLEMLSLAVSDIEGATVDFYGGYVVDYMRKKGIDKIIKGYRTKTDLEYERIQAEYNFANGGFETELYESASEYRSISSTLARERILSGESLDGILPEAVIKYIKDKKRSI